MIHVDETGSSGREPPSSGATSRSLLDRVKADDGAAWETLVGLYGPVVYRWVKRWDVSEHEAADVFQDVFHSLAKNIGEFRKENAGDTFRGWLHRITDNKVRDHLRKLGRQPGGEGGTKPSSGWRICPSPASANGRSRLAATTRLGCSARQSSSYEMSSKGGHLAGILDDGG